MRHLTIAALALAVPAPALAQTEIGVSRFFGSCEADYGDVVRAAEGRGECGIVTALINEFNDTHEDYQVREEIVEWPGYDQLTARLRTGDAPTISVMHQSILSDYQSRDLLLPLGDLLTEAGVDLSDMTEAAEAGVTKEGEVYALPFDTLGWLWHVNMGLFEEAGLVEDGAPVLPSSPEELLAQARQFKEATGKPYFVQSGVTDVQSAARNLLTLLYQQDVDFFADPTAIDLGDPAAAEAVELFRTLVEEALTTSGMDYSAATAAFPNGAGGVYIMGTWLVDTYEEAAQAGEQALTDYAVVPFPQLFENEGIWSDGHSWVIPRQDLTDEEREAAAAFLAFLWDNNIHWARTGHLPVRQSVIEGDEFSSLPHRDAIARQAEVGRALPPEVRRQFTLMDVLGEELNAAIAGQKPTEEALATAEERANDLLARANR